MVRMGFFLLFRSLHLLLLLWRVWEIGRCERIVAVFGCLGYVGRFAVLSDTFVAGLSTTPGRRDDCGIDARPGCKALDGADAGPEGTC
jgi:hypothetical protein